jgi:hypothetical protein
MKRTGNPSMCDQADPVFLHARREAVVILIAFVAFLVWSVSCSFLMGYGAPNGDPIVRVLGMPGWAFWGVLVPWFAADVFALWFCFFYMADDRLEDSDDGWQPETSGEADAETNERHRHA